MKKKWSNRGIFFTSFEITTVKYVQKLALFSCCFFNFRIRNPTNVSGLCPAHFPAFFFLKWEWTHSPFFSLQTLPGDLKCKSHQQKTQCKSILMIIVWSMFLNYRETDWVRERERREEQETSWLEDWISCVSNKERSNWTKGLFIWTMQHTSQWQFRRKTNIK